MLGDRDATVVAVAETEPTTQAAHPKERVALP
jgi:hypothetical protein